MIQIKNEERILYTASPVNTAHIMRLVMFAVMLDFSSLILNFSYSDFHRESSLLQVVICCNHEKIQALIQSTNPCEILR